MLLAAMLIFSACASTDSSKESLRKTLYDYQAAIRWNELDAAIGFVDPDTLAEKPITDLERERFKQVQFVSYELKSTAPLGENEIERLVELRFVNRHNQAERTLQVRERWRLNTDNKRWMLVSGLPDLTPNL